MKEKMKKNKQPEIVSSENQDNSASSVAKEMSKGSKKKTAIYVCSFLAGGVILGAAGGAIAARILKPETVDFSDVNQEELVDNVDNDDLMTRYQKCIDEGKEPSQEFTIDEIINISTIKFRERDNTITLGYGYAEAAGKISVMDVRNTCIRNGDTYFEESVSKSASGPNIQLAERAYQTGDEIRVHKGTFSKGANAEHPNWSTEYEVWEKEPYRKNYGKYVDTLGIYIISTKTILFNAVDENGNPLTYIKKDDTGYTIMMSMDTVKTVIPYVQRMNALSGTGVSKFDYVNLEYRLDLNLDLVYSYVHEQYFARLGNIAAKTTGRMITYYYFDDQYMIPEVTTPINYDLKGEKLPKE